MITKTMTTVCFLALSTLLTACSSNTIYVEEEPGEFNNIKENRYVDKHLLDDLSFFHDVQKRLYDVSEKGYSTTTYPYCLAQTNLDKATEQYNNNDRSDYVEESLESSLVILNQMEVYLDDIIYPKSEHNEYTVRKDIWNLVYNAKDWMDNYKILELSECGQCTLAELELELVNAQHLNSELGLRNALPSVRKAERLATKLNQEIADCKMNKLYKFIARSIYFDYNKDNLRDASIDRLKVVLKLMKENKSMRINIIGYADPRGQDRYNLNLSQSRALSAYSYLKKNGVSARRMTIIARGETNQIKDHFDQPNHAINRRVDIYIQNKK